MKNLVYGIIIVACIALALVVFKFTRSKSSGGIDTIDKTEMVWIKCRSCNQAYQMSKRDYYKVLSEKSTPGMMYAPPLTCEKCGKPTALLAEKCPNCGEVFISGSVPGDQADRCPKCKHSAIEDSRKARLAGRQQAQ